MQAILVDLDGTLIDSAPDLVRVLNETLAAEGYPPVSLAFGRPLISRGVSTMIRSGVDQAGGSTRAEDIARMKKHYLAIYEAEPVRDSKVYPSAREVLTDLRSRGALLGLCTNKRHDLAVKVMDDLMLTPLFAEITGAGIAGNNKPSPEPLLHTLREMQRQPKQAVMIGDSAADIEAARAAGVASIAVDFGYSSEPARSFGADKVIGNWRELADALAGL